MSLTKDNRFYNWCFTSFKNRKAMEDIDKTRIKYIIFQEEICPESKRDHLQGYVEFKDKVSLKTAKSILGDPQMHLEVRMGTQTQAIEYCRKSDSRREGAEPVTYGKCGKQGNRTDLDALYTMAEQHMTCKEMLQVAQGNGLRHIHCYEKAMLAMADMLRSDEKIKEYRESKILEKEQDEFVMQTKGLEERCGEVDKKTFEEAHDKICDKSVAALLKNLDRQSESTEESSVYTDEDGDECEPEGPSEDVFGFKKSGKK